ncbi:MAG: hypothetical protein U5L02_02060 [Rheinheimera sp.]|nr:hypothetical protein [Rheinheimera sp.]
MVDDAAQLPALQQVMAEASFRLNLLLELGVPGGRCGVGGGAVALKLATQIRHFPAL